MIWTMRTEHRGRWATTLPRWETCAATLSLRGDSGDSLTSDFYDWPRCRLVGSP